MQSLARNKRNANETTMWVMLIHKTMFEIMSSTEAGLENNMYMLVMMPSK